MTDSRDPLAILVHNQNGLEELSWTIEASQGQFSLILARCNYTQLREHLIQHLQEICPVEIRVLRLQQSSKTLYTRIREEQEQGAIAALTIMGLERVTALDTMFAAVNSVREEFRKNFPFPIVLWVTDDVHRLLMKLAPDLESWATSTNFSLPPNVLLEKLREASDRLFSSLLTPDSNASFLRLLQTLDFGFLQRSELETALQDLHNLGQTSPPDLQATLDFIRGLNAPTPEAALDHLYRSLTYWQQAENSLAIQNPKSKIQNSLISALLLYFIGRTIYDRCNQNKYREANWELAKPSLQDCLQRFEQAQRLDLVAKSITQLERTLARLEDWQELGVLAEKSLPLQQTYGDRSRTAEDYRYLAWVTIQQGRGAEAQRYAQLALDTLQQVPEDKPYRGLYLLTLAQALHLQGQQEAAMIRLEEAHALPDQGFPRVYIAILEALHNSYQEQKQYLEAFRLKQERLSVEQQYRFRAFVGAGRLQAQRQDQELLRFQTPDRSSADRIAQTNESGGIAFWQRQREVKRLLERIGRNDCQLTVIHGYSGVGKSSLISAGLVPALEQKAIGVQDNLPVVVRKYTNWVEALGQQLVSALDAYFTNQWTQHSRNLANLRVRLLQALGRDDITDFQQLLQAIQTGNFSAAELLLGLQQLDRENLRTVLIFDQFEEFFFVHSTPQQRRPFFQFLGECLKLLSVKVILPLREDYLHYLLELNRIPAIQERGIDILSREVLYPLGNFSAAEATKIIQELTEQARYYLESDLVEELVKDLTDENGEVRPVELQIVGAQLQTDGIRDLPTYRTLRSPNKPAKEVLVERYLGEVVADCGPDNEQVAELVLYLLTNENDTRPLKTKQELVEALGQEPASLDLVLEILVRSGLVMQLPERPEDCYQLVHDYLVSYIRRQRSADLLAELEQERGKRPQADRLRAMGINPDEV